MVAPTAHWRDSSRSIKLFIWDGKITFPILLFLFYIHIWTLIVVITSMVFFSILIRYGFTPIVFLRWFRSLLAGSRKVSTPWWLQ